MKASVGLVAIVAGLATASPLAGSAKTARGNMPMPSDDEFINLRMTLMFCLEANAREYAHMTNTGLSSWAGSMASTHKTKDKIIEAIKECEAKEAKAKEPKPKGKLWELEPRPRRPKGKKKRPANTGLHLDVIRTRPHKGQ